MEDITGSEMVRIHHHEIHKKRTVRSSILQLESKSGIVIGHDKCAELLTENAASFLEQEILLDAAAQNTLLDEISPVFTDEDNLTLIKTPDDAEVLEVLKKSNLHAAPGTDSITNYFYLQFYDVIGKHLGDVVRKIFTSESPTSSQHTSIMVFANKPKKMASIKIKDKRKISLLNSDFKVLTGIESLRHSKLLDHTVSPRQFAAGKNRKISHAINLARDTVFSASRSKEGAALADLDFEAAFDFLCMEWVELVLAKKGLHQEVIDRIRRYYTGGVTIPMVNDVPGKKIHNHRRTLRQGDCPSLWSGSIAGIPTPQIGGDHHNFLYSTWSGI